MGEEVEVTLIFLLNISLSWVEIRLYTEFQLPVLFRSAFVSINPIMGGGGPTFVVLIFILVGLKVQGSL